MAQLGAIWLNDVLDEPNFVPEKAQTVLHNGIGQVVRPAGGNAMRPPQVAQANAQTQNYLVTETPLGIPAMIHDECCSGYHGPRRGCVSAEHWPGEHLGA